MPASELPLLLAAVRAQLVSMSRDAEITIPGEQIGRLAALLAQRLETLPEREQLLTLAMLPPARLAPGMEALDRAALVATNPRVAAIAVLSRVAGLDNPVVAQWADMDEPSAARELSRALLEARALGRTGGLASAAGSYNSLAPQRSLPLAGAP